MKMKNSSELINAYWGHLVWRAIREAVGFLLISTRERLQIIVCFIWIQMLAVFKWRAILSLYKFRMNWLNFRLKQAYWALFVPKKNSDSESRMRFIFYGRYEALLIDFEYIIIIIKYY